MYVLLSAHIVGRVAAIKFEAVLVTGHAADVPVDILAGLKDSQARSVGSSPR
jgi:hypothetical protein